MAIRTIREYGDDILTKKCKEIKGITPRIRELAADMMETMHEAGGVGLAAPQVGILKRLFVIDVTGEDAFVMINPEIEETDGEQTGYEGCLSLPGKSGIVKRANHVVMKGYNLDMEPIRVEGEELLARALLHEFDHLNGHMYVEKVEGELVNNEDLEEAQPEEE